MRRILEFFRREEGVTLPEMMVGMALGLVVGSVLLTGTIALFRTQTFTTQDSEALIALRVSLDRMEREVRQARRMYSDSTATAAHFWVDYDRDNQQDLGEKITWSVVTVGAEAELHRKTDTAGATPKVIAREFVGPAASPAPPAIFSYCMDATPRVNPCTNGKPATPNAGAATVIRITFTADSVPAVRAPRRTVETEVRLRNASAP
ncbi:MAG TPA: hypothetical protein VND22_07465 [Actinomycetota bacterium]|nr:hypothetical protein [Actinomycetota bacterium]